MLCQCAQIVYKYRIPLFIPIYLYSNNGLFAISVSLTRIINIKIKVINKTNCPQHCIKVILGCHYLEWGHVLFLFFTIVVSIRLQNYLSPADSHTATVFNFILVLSILTTFIQPKASHSFHVYWNTSLIMILDFPLIYLLN